MSYVFAPPLPEANYWSLLTFQWYYQPIFWYKEYTMAVTEFIIASNAMQLNLECLYLSKKISILTNKNKNSIT